MRKPSFLLLTNLLLLGVLTTLPVHAAPTVSLSLLDSDIQVGETFNVQVMVDGDGIGDELLAFGFDVSVTGNAFSYNGYKLESGFDDLSSGGNNVTGDVFPGISEDDVLIATLSFTGTCSGIGKLSIDGQFDGNFSGLFYEFSGFDIKDTININVVPIPASAVLLISGIIGISGIKKKFGPLRRRTQSSSA